MKVFNSKLAAIGLAAFVFASCSDNTSDSTGDSSPAKVDATTLDLTNSGESLFSSVINYKNSTANARKFFGTRAASDANFVTDLNKDVESTIPVQPATATQALGNDNLENGIFYLKKSAGECDFTVPRNVNMLTINSVSSSSVADLTNESNLTANKTNVNLPNANYIIPQSLRIQFRNIDKVLYSVSNGHNKGYSAVEAGINNAFTPMPGNYGIPEDTTKFRGRYMVKNMRVLPGSKYRVTVASKGFVKIGYYTDGTNVEINYDDATDQYQNYHLRGCR